MQKSTRRGLYGMQNTEASLAKKALKSPWNCTSKATHQQLLSNSIVPLLRSLALLINCILFRIIINWPIIEFIIELLCKIVYWIYVSNFPCIWERPSSFLTSQLSKIIRTQAFPLQYLQEAFPVLIGDFGISRSTTSTQSHSLPLLTKMHIKSLRPPICSRRVAEKTVWSSILSTLEDLAPQKSETSRKSGIVANNRQFWRFPQSLRFLYFVRLVFTANPGFFRDLGWVDWFRFARRGYDFGFAWLQLWAVQARTKIGKNVEL